MASQTGDSAWASKSTTPDILYLVPPPWFREFTADPTPDPDSTSSPPSDMTRLVVEFPVECDLPPGAFSGF
jgi:hypothetical protein